LGIGRDDQKLGFCNLQPATFLASTGTEQNRLDRAGAGLQALDDPARYYYTYIRTYI